MHCDLMTSNDTLRRSQRPAALSEGHFPWRAVHFARPSVAYVIELQFLKYHIYGEKVNFLTVSVSKEGLACTDSPSLVTHMRRLTAVLKKSSESHQTTHHNCLGS